MYLFTSVCIPPWERWNERGYAIPQLKVHVDAALNRGATQEQLIATITQMIDYCGFPASTNALLAAKEVFDAREVQSD